MRSWKLRKELGRDILSDPEREDLYLHKVQIPLAKAQAMAKAVASENSSENTSRPTNQYGTQLGAAHLRHPAEGKAGLIRNHPWHETPIPKT